MPSTPKKTVSFIVPCYNEEAMIGPFLDQMGAALAPLDGYVYEFIFVDDGSEDGTEAVLAAHAARDPHVKAVALSRNFGHQRAITAGLDFCGGEYVVIMDADLQDPAEVVPGILAKLEEGFDLVHTVRADRSADSYVKRTGAGLFYAFMRRWVLPELPRNAGDFKGFNRRVLEALRQYPERVRFLRGLFATLGFRQATVSFTRPLRLAGRSKYHARNVLRFARDAVVSNSVLPLRLGLYAGLLTWLLLPLYAIVCGIAWWCGRLTMPPVWVLIGFMALFFGLVLVLLGIMGEYLKILILETKGRPHYLVRALYNVPPPAPRT